VTPAAAAQLPADFAPKQHCRQLTGTTGTRRLGAVIPLLHFSSFFS